MKNEFLLHTLSTIFYRFQKTVSSAKTDFGNFSLGKRSRTPAQIINHMYHVLYATRMFIMEEEVQEAPPKRIKFSLEINRFKLELKKIDDVLCNKELGINYAKKVLQGPLSDILTHIGQISMLRRLSGDPITGEDFSSAPIKTGIT